jgi:hypothetical protein
MLPFTCRRHTSWASSLSYIIQTCNTSTLNFRDFTRDINLGTRSHFSKGTNHSHYAKLDGCREAFFDSVIVHPHGVMYQSKASFLDGEQAGVRVTI